MDDLLLNKKHIHYAKIFAIGIIVQGIYHQCSIGNLKIKYFLLYLILSFITSLLYYKIFSD